MGTEEPARGDSYLLLCLRTKSLSSERFSLPVVLLAIPSNLSSSFMIACTEISDAFRRRLTKIFFILGVLSCMLLQ